jgi:Lhr-like helicase
MGDLYDFQREAVRGLMRGKHIVIAGTGSGKGTTAVVWAREKCHETGKDKVLVVTTASKANMKPNDFELDADKWNGEEWRK